MQTADDIGQSVLRMYLAHPFPQWTREERHRRFASELCRYRFLGVEDVMPGSRFLDVGCGTGNRSMLAAKHFGVKEFVGIDRSAASLEVAGRVAEEEAFDRFTPVLGDLFALPYPDHSFDVVVSWGVLHHTDDPFRGLEEMVRVCRPGGYIGLFLYNKWNHWRHNMQKNKVSRLAGPDVERRFEVAHRLYGTKPVDAMTPEEVAVFYDKYCHPHKSDHTLGEILSWFNRLGLTYWGSYPPLRMRNFVGLLQYRGALLPEYPMVSRPGRLAVETAMKMSSLRNEHTLPFRLPSRMHRFFWQAVYAWQGRRGEYSGGAALSARKTSGS